MPRLADIIAGFVVILLSVNILLGCDSSQRKAEQAYQHGISLKLEGKYQQAAQQFRLALTHDPQHARTMFEFGVALCATHNYREAAKQLLRALEYGATSYKTYAWLGYAYERLGREALTEQAYQQAIIKAPRNIDLRLRLADLFESQGRRRETAQLLTQVLALQPMIEDARFLNERALLLRQPESPENHYALAGLYLQHGQIERGKAEYRQVARLDPNDPESMTTFGVFCLEHKQFQTAVESLEHAKQTGRETDLNVRAGLGVAYESLGETQSAIVEYQAALQLAPKWFEIYAKLAQLLEELGRTEEAAETLESLFYASRQAEELDTTEWFADVNTLWAEILRLRGETSTKTVVRLTRSGQYQLVEATVNHQLSVQLHLEQRARYTILSERLARELGIQITARTSEVRFEIAGKTYSAPLVNLPALQIGGVEVRNIPTLIWNLSEYPGIDGFLGMTFLKHFHVDIQDETHLLILVKNYS